MDRGNLIIHPENLNESIRGLSNFDFNFSNKTCAIVGSSPNILKTGYGKDIDSHDIVVRCNFALTNGFEKDAGSKTTHRFMSRSTFSGSRNSKDFSSYDSDFLHKVFNEHFIIRTGGDSHMNWAQKHVEEKYSNTTNKIDFLTESFQNHVQSQINGEPSAGFTAMMFMICFFDTISIYGFDHHGGISGKESRHYYEKTNVKTGVVHNFAGEKEIFKVLEKRGVLKTYE